MDAKRRLHDAEEETVDPPCPASDPIAAVQRGASTSSHNVSSVTSAKSCPGLKQPARNQGGVSLNLNDELEQEANNDKNIGNNGGLGGKAGHTNKKKENLCPNNLAAMKQIMKRKQMANAARKDLDLDTGACRSTARAAPLATASREEKTSEQKSDKNPEGTPLEREEDVCAETALPTDYGGSNNAANETSVSSPPDSKDTSVWAMLGNHLDESTLDQDQSSILMISPASWKNGNYCGPISRSGDGDSSGEEGATSGASGVLSFLGESPLFDTAIVEKNEVERNLSRSAERMNKIEGHLLRSSKADGGLPLSPVQPAGAGEEGATAANDVKEHGPELREKEVTFAVGWETPNAGGSFGRSAYRKSPYVAMSQYADDRSTGLMMTPLSTFSEGMELEANPMSESVIVSDDEASGENNGSSPSPTKGVGDDVEEGNEDDEDALEAWSKEFDNHLKSSVVDNFDHVKSPEPNGLEKQHCGRSNGSKSTTTTPTRASLMERNQTLVREVRFADQTCVELSERKKHYKNEAGKQKKMLAEANEKSSLLRENYESSLQETAELKVLVESLRAQKHQADAQVEAYRTHINSAEMTHRAGLKKIEETYHSHLKKSEEQVQSLNERLHQSLDANINLQTKLDTVHDKWESKIETDAASQELISRLKERVAAGDAAASAAKDSWTTTQARIVDLQALHDLRADELQRERNERKMIEYDRDSLQAQCENLHAQLTEWAQASDTLGDIFLNEDGSQNEDFLVESLKKCTPPKRCHLNSSDNICGDAAHHPRTPTSNLLARTLRSELKIRHKTFGKLKSAEHQVTKLKRKLSNTKMDVEEAKADNALLEEDLEEKCAHISKLEDVLEEKDELIARLNEELQVCFRMEGANASAVASVGRSSSGTESSHFESEPETASVLEERLEAVEDPLEYTDKDLANTVARLAETQEILDHTAGELQRSEEELAKAHDQVANYESQVKILLNELADKDKFSEYQTLTLETMKEKLTRNDATNAELRTKLSSCFKSLMALEKILRTYEDMDGYVGQKMAEQSCKIASLLETIENFVQEHGALLTQDLESGALGLSCSNLEEKKTESGLDEFASMASSSSVNSQNSTWTLHYQQQLVHLRKEVAIVEMERDDVSTQLQKAHGVLQELRDELAKQESEHLEETASLKEQCQDLESKLSLVNEDLIKGRKENQSSSKTVVAADYGVSQQLSVIRSNNAELIEENESLRVDLQYFELQLEDRKALLCATREEADGYRQDLSNAKAAFECLTTECDLTKASLAELEKEAHVTRRKIAQKEEELQDCHTCLSAVQASFKEQKADFEAKSLLLETNRNNAEASLDSASKRIAILEDAAKENDKKYQEKHQELELQTEEKAEVVVHLKEVQKAISEAEKEKAEASNIIMQLENQINEKSSVLFAYEGKSLNRSPFL